MIKRKGKTLLLSGETGVLASAAIGGQKEGEGPLKDCFDLISQDSYFGEKSWEKAESHMLRQCLSLACDKAKLPSSELDCVFSGDLLNQCVSSAFAARELGVPYFGLYGACSTMTESLTLAAIQVESGCARTACAVTGSHFCTAERQYRFPLEYGGQRTPSSQWTVTGSGALVLGKNAPAVRVMSLTPGRIVDAGITDANNMGAAMAPAAYDTLSAHFTDTGRGPDYYDAIFTGDLGALGHDILQELFSRDGVKLGPRYMDCGVLIYDLVTQDVHAGGSGCGCCASVLCGHILDALSRGVWKRVLVAATGALMSPLSCQQGESIPGICHAVGLELKA